MRAPTLRPVAAAFVLFGVFWGAWAVSTADVEHALGFSNAAFGLLLSAALFGAAAANAAVGSLTERWGTATAMRRCLVLWGALLVVGACVHPVAAFAVLMVGVVSSGGALDVVMNIASAAALADRPGRLVRFHGLFNAGAAAGALTTGLLLRGGVSWRWVWLGAGLAALVLAVLTGRATLPAGGVGDHHSLAEGLRALRTEGLVLLSVAFGAGAMIEGGIDTWGVLYLRRSLNSGLLLGTGAATLGYAVAAVARVTLGPAAGSAGAPRGVGIGAGVAAAGLLALGLAGAPVPAAAGLVAAAMGISVCWPLLIAQASTGRQRPGLVVGGMSAVGYLGLVMGPAVVGALAGTVGLRAGLLLLAAAAVFVAVVPARATRTRPTLPA
jgi:MFS family permease